MFKAMFNTGRLAYGLADRLFFKAAWGEFNNCQLENQNTQLSYRRLTSECEEVVNIRRDSNSALHLSSAGAE